MDDSDPDGLTRRTFIGVIASFSVLSSLLPFNSLSVLFASEKSDSFKSRKRLEGSFRFFSPHQATVIEEVTSLIIPSDRSPGAREAGVVLEIDKAIAKNQKLGHSYARGIEALDLMARQLAGRDNFLALSQEEKMEILNMAYASKSLFSRGGISNQYGSMLPGILLINHLIPKTIEIFYMSEAGWKAVGYQGPPQWKGNLDYDKCGF